MINESNKIKLSVEKKILIYIFDQALINKSLQIILAKEWKSVDIDAVDMPKPSESIVTYILANSVFFSLWIEKEHVI